MGKRVKSARGQVVDFDLLKIKEQIAAAPAPVDVQQRQDFVERRLRRRVKKKPLVVESGGDVVVEPSMPETENPDVVETKIDEEPVPEVTPKAKPKAKSRTKQPARKSIANE